MKRISLGGKNGRGKFVLVDDEDFEELSEYKWRLDRRGYARMQVNIGRGRQKTVSMHRMIVNTPSGMFTDHIDHNTLNNQKSNLRICNAKENMRNRNMQKNNSSGFRGVSFYKRTKQWSAMISVDSRSIHLGLFNNKIEAAIAYNEAAKKYHGEFAALNEIPKKPEIAKAV